PIILVWWPPTWKNLPKNKQFYLERNFQGECGNCRLTMNRRLLNQSKVVVFDNLPNAANLTAEQAYVLWHRETPAKTFHLRSAMVGVFDTMFNYTMSYRRDSDFRWYSGMMYVFSVKEISFTRLYIDEIIKSKRRLATWVVSNCNNTRGAVERKKYVFKLLEAGLKIDMYGKCFGQRITKNNFTTFLSSYKFYLAFENSWHCRDYVTEKFWRNGIMAGVVPVVWGPTKEDVAEVAPVGSYIHIEDFESPKALVDYLIYLDKNDHEYRRYFNWRKTAITEDGTEPMQTIRPGYEAPLCQMCRRIIQSKGKLPKRVLNSTLSWVFGN
uniref:Fucosyltransferase n=1 Tax=Ciona intestinalis TaxID=7719 RepID=H2XZA1_CIOIN